MQLLCLLKAACWAGAGVQALMGMQPPSRAWEGVLGQSPQLFLLAQTWAPANRGEEVVLATQTGHQRQPPRGAVS